MGSEDSKPNKSSNIFLDSKLNDSYISSDYNNISSSLTENSNSKNSNKKPFIPKENKDEKNNTNNNNKLPVTFEWEGGGNSVYLSGSFCNWKQFFLMQKNAEGKYILKLDINKEFIQYKFKVDNVWKINEKLPSIYDHGNLNNYIDCTKCDISKEKSELTTDDNTESSFILNNNNYHSNKYGNLFPKIKDRSDVKIAPENYWKKTITGNSINKNCNNIENEKINHMNYNIINSNRENNSTIVSVVCRYRLKYANFIYYKSTQNDG